MQQVSPKRPVTYHMTHPDHAGATVQVRPPTQPQIAHIQGAIARDGANLGDVAYETARKHVISWEGMPGAPRDFDELPVSAAIELMSFVSLGCVFTEDDAKN